MEDLDPERSENAKDSLRLGSILLGEVEHPSLELLGNPLSVPVFLRVRQVHAVLEEPVHDVLESRPFLLLVASLSFVLVSLDHINVDDCVWHSDLVFQQVKLHEALLGPIHQELICLDSHSQ